MKHTLQRICMSVCVVILVTGMLGCERESNTPSDPNLPQPGIEVFPYSPARADFYVLGTSSDELGVYVGDGFFMVQIPAGEYLLRYITERGMFHLVCRVNEPALIFIGLQEDDVIQDAWLFAGTITDVGQETQDHGTVMLFSWPGSSAEWWEVFSF